MIRDDSPVNQTEALVGMDKILPSVDFDPSIASGEEIIYETIAETGCDTRLSYLLSSTSDEILGLVVKVYEKIPWGSYPFEDTQLPDVNVVEILLRRLMDPNCRVFTAATRALGLFLPSHIVPGITAMILDSGILRSEAFVKIITLSSSSNPWIQRAVTSMLSQVGCSVENSDDEKACIDAGVAQAFLLLLTSHHDGVQNEAVMTIREFTTKGAQYCNAFFSAQVLPALSAHHSTWVRNNRDGLLWSSQRSFAILEILAEAKVSAPLEAFIHPAITEIVVEQLTGLILPEAEAALGSLVRRYHYVPETLTITHFIRPIITLLTSSDDYKRGGAARAIWLISRHYDGCFSKVFLNTGVAWPLAMLLSFSNEFALTSASCAIRSLLNTDQDGLATRAFNDAGVIEILTPRVHNTDFCVASLAQATISAIKEPYHDHGLDTYASMELVWARALREAQWRR